MQSPGAVEQMFPPADKLLQQILTCLSFYTRLPVGRWLASDNDFAAAQWAAPVAGAFIGLCGGFAYTVSAAVGLPPPVAAVVCIGATIFLTGALHEDGAADTADGFGGGESAKQKLEIMRDSRLGTYGALALLFSVLTRWSAISALIDPLTVMIAVIAAHAASRAVIAEFLLLVPPARNDGLSATVGTFDSGTASISLAIGVGVLFAGGLLFAVGSALLLALWFFALQWLCRRQIGGQTGDVIGALQQGAEVIILVTAIIVTS